MCGAAQSTVLSVTSMCTACVLPVYSVTHAEAQLINTVTWPPQWSGTQQRSEGDKPVVKGAMVLDRSRSFFWREVFPGFAVCADKATVGAHWLGFGREQGSKRQESCSVESGSCTDSAGPVAQSTGLRVTSRKSIQFMENGVGLVQHFFRGEVFLDLLLSAAKATVGAH